jgi:hypothetical protein
VNFIRVVTAVAGLSGFVIPRADAQKVDIQFDHQVDFSHIRRYEWRTHPIFEKNPELKEKYATGIQLVLEAGNKELANRGLRPVEESPDVFVTFFIAGEGAQQIRTYIESGWGSGYGWYGAPSWTVTEIEHYVRGLIVIEMIDTRTSKLLWRAWGGDRIKDWHERHKNINSVVKKALGKFPPKR